MTQSTNYGKTIAEHRQVKHKHYVIEPTGKWVKTVLKTGQQSKEPAADPTTGTASKFKSKWGDVSYPSNANSSETAPKDPGDGKSSAGSSGKSRKPSPTGKNRKQSHDKMKADLPPKFDKAGRIIIDGNQPGWENSICARDASDLLWQIATSNSLPKDKMLLKLYEAWADVDTEALKDALGLYLTKFKEDAETMKVFAKRSVFVFEITSSKSERRRALQKEETNKMVRKVNMLLASSSLWERKIAYSHIRKLMGRLEAWFVTQLIELLNDEGIEAVITKPGVQADTYILAFARKMAGKYQNFYIFGKDYDFVAYGDNVTELISRTKGT
jgi:hypothetical protein